MVKTLYLNFIRNINSIFEWYLALSCLLLIIIVVIAVFWRYVLGAPLLWPGQLSRIILVNGVFLGLGVSYINNAHISVKTLIVKFPDKTRRIFYVVHDIAFVGIGIIVFISSLQFAELFSFMAVRPLNISISYLVLPIPIGLIIMILFIIYKYMNSQNSDDG